MAAELSEHPSQPSRAHPAECPDSGSQTLESLLHRASPGRQRTAEGPILALLSDLEASPHLFPGCFLISR
jgi:hypothetical protein